VISEVFIFIYSVHPGKPAAATFLMCTGKYLEVTNSISYALWTHENSEVLEEIPTKNVEIREGREICHLLREEPDQLSFIFEEYNLLN